MVQKENRRLSIRETGYKFSPVPQEYGAERVLFWWQKKFIIVIVNLGHHRQSAPARIAGHSVLEKG